MIVIRFCVKFPLVNGVPLSCRKRMKWEPERTVEGTTWKPVKGLLPCLNVFIIGDDDDDEDDDDDDDDDGDDVDDEVNDNEVNDD